MGTSMIQLHQRVGQVDDEVINAWVTVDYEDYDDLARFVWYYKKDNPGTYVEHVSIGRNLDPIERKVTGLQQELMNRRILRLAKGTFISGWFDKDPLNMTRANLYVKVGGHKVNGMAVRLLYDAYDLYTSQAEIPASVSLQGMLF